MKILIEVKVLVQVSIIELELRLATITKLRLNWAHRTDTGYKKKKRHYVI